MSGAALERIRSHLAQLERLDLSRSRRLLCWRLIIDSAQQAHALELEELDSLKFIAADPATEVPV